MRSFRTSIQQKILLLLLVVALPPLLLVGWLGLTGLARARDTATREGTNALRAQAEQNLAQQVSDKIALYDAALIGVQQQVESTARYAEVLYSDTAPPARDDLVWVAPTGPDAPSLARYPRSVSFARALVPLFQSVAAYNKLVNLS